MVKFLKLYEKIGIFIFLVAGGVFLSFASPYFLKGDTILNIVTQGTYGAIVGFGMTLAITIGGFDLSVDAVMSLTSVFLSILIPVAGIPLAILMSVIIACSVGLINGLIITKLKVNPLITTLAMMTIIKGVALLVAGGRQIVIHQKVFMELGTGKTLGIPNPIYIMIVLFVIFYFLLYHTPFGRHISAVGSNENAARISGLKVDLIKILTFVLVSFTASIAGTIRTSQTLIGIPTMSPGFVLVAITVTILGGTSLSGGKGNLWGTLFAGVFISMIYYGLNLIGVQIFYQMLSVGLVLIFALFIDGIRNRYLETIKAKGIKV
ncbi:MAG TPA: ABC transporter permease [Spirochaetes bacterium]|nr:ABC transporter permease [Spirochaetota bacterium]